MGSRVLETAVEDGVLLELVEQDGALAVKVGGRVAMAAGARGIERELAELTIETWRGRDDISVLIGGLGMGRAVRAALDQPGVVRVDVVEASPAIIDWEARHFAELNGGATADPRVHVHRGELVSFLRMQRQGDLPPDGWFVILLDLDEFPARVERPGNAFLYTDEGLALLEDGMRGGGVMGIWTTQRDDEFNRRMHRRLQGVSRIAVPASDGLRYIYRGRRGARRAN